MVRSRRTRAQYEVYEAMLRATSRMERGFAELMKEHELSTTQYNVLRILRGAGEAGVTCGQIADRLIRHDPDITRLLDRLEGRGLITRVRDPRDRRQVRTCATPAALTLLAALDEPVDALHEQQLGHMSEAGLRDLRRLIDRTGLTD